MLWGGGAVALVVLVVVVAIVLQREVRPRRRASVPPTPAPSPAERVRLTKLQAPHRGAAPDLRPAADATDPERLAARAALVKAVEGAITRDAQARARRGEIDGPIRGSECGPFLRAPDAVPDDRVLTKPIGRYDCVAVKDDIQGDQRLVGRQPRLPVRRRPRLPPLHLRLVPQHAAAERARRGARVRPPRPRLPRREGPRARHRLRGRAGLVARRRRVSGCGGGRPSRPWPSPAPAACCAACGGAARRPGSVIGPPWRILAARSRESVRIATAMPPIRMIPAAKISTSCHVFRPPSPGAPSWTAPAGRSRSGVGGAPEGRRLLRAGRRGDGERAAPSPPSLTPDARASGRV